MNLSYPDLARLCRSLGLLLHGGISVADGLYLLSQEESAALRPLLEDLGREMDTGSALSQAMEDSGAFPGHVCGMVAIGEETGRLEESLHALADFYEERQRTSRQIRNAVAYPGLVMVLMLAVVGVLLVKVLPVFDSVYASLGSRLTGAAAGLLYLGQLLEGTLPVLFGVLLGLAGILLVLRLCPKWRDMLKNAWQARFGDRGIARKFNNARFARALAMGLSSGLPLENALELARNLLSDIPGAANRCEACAKALEGGAALNEAMEENGLLPPAQCRMLSLGIRGGNADQVMANVADQMMEDARESLEATISRIEPAMVLTASLLVGLILLAVMLPLLDIMAALG